MTSCSCGSDMTEYGDGLYVCMHEDLGHQVGSCATCLVYQRVTNARI